MREGNVSSCSQFPTSWGLRIYWRLKKKWHNQSLKWTGNSLAFLGNILKFFGLENNVLGELHGQPLSLALPAPASINYTLAIGGKVMDTKTLELFARYNSATNIKMGEIISGLSSQQWEKEFKGYFNSIKSLCNHIYIADFNWLKRFSALRQFAYIQDACFQKNIGFTETVIGSNRDFSSLRKSLDDRINMFVSEVTSDWERI